MITFDVFASVAAVSFAVIFPASITRGEIAGTSMIRTNPFVTAGAFSLAMGSVNSTVFLVTYPAPIHLAAVGNIGIIKIHRKGIVIPNEIWTIEGVSGFDCGNDQTGNNGARIAVTHLIVSIHIDRMIGCIRPGEMHILTIVS